MTLVRNQETLERLGRLLEQTCGDMHKSCKKLGTSYGSVKAWMRDDQKVEAYITDAIEAGTSGLVSHAIKRATVGVREPIFHQGIEVGEKRKYSDGLLETLLKARDPAFANKIDINKTITVKTLSDSELDKRIEDFSVRLGLTYQPIEDAEFTDVEDAETVDIDLDDLL